MVMRSMPMPKAKPEYFSGSMLQFFSTSGSTMPEPPISTQPLYLQILQPAPLQIRHEISISALGSVNGKNDGRNRICGFGTEHFLHKIIKRLFQVGKAYVFVNKQTFYLVKNAVRPGRNSFVAVHAARRKRTDGRLLVFHYPHLHAGGMRTQQHIAFHKKSVLHVAGRVVFREVQGRKIMPVVFNFRAFG